MRIWPALTAIAVGLLSLGASGAWSPASAPLVAVGDVTDTAAVLWARGPTAGPLRLELTTAEPAWRRSLVIEPWPGRDLTARVRLDALTPGTRYDYRLHAGAAAVTGHFVTAPAPDRPAPLRLLWSGDLGARGFCRPTEGGYAVFDTMASRRPERFLFLGDTIYADHRCAGDGIVPGGDFVARTLAEFHAKHRYARQDPAMQRFLTGTAVWATWDDHDVRNNFAGPEEELMAVGRQAFVDYWPIDTPAGEPRRLYRRFRHGSLAEIFILDTRQYRSGNCRRDGPDKTMLGERQRRWLTEGLATSSALWKLVASSVPVSITKGWPCGDSWAAADLLVLTTGFADERDAILRDLRDRGVANVVFLVADVHFALVAAHEPWSGFRFYELIAGPLAARPKRSRTPDGDLGSRVLFAAGGRATFGEVEIEPHALTVRIFDGAGSLLWDRRLIPAATPTPRPAGTSGAGEGSRL